MIHHFAGDVIYSSDKFLDKNTDALSPQFEGELKKSSVELMRQCVLGVQAPVNKEGKVPGQMTPRGGRKSVFRLLSESPALLAMLLLALAFVVGAVACCLMPGWDDDADERERWAAAAAKTEAAEKAAAAAAAKGEKAE